MWKMLMLVVLLSAGFFSAGCETLTRSSEDSIRQYSRVSDLNRRMLGEDIETFWLLERPSRLSQWYLYREPVDVTPPPSVLLQ